MKEIWLEDIPEWKLDQQIYRVWQSEKHLEPEDHERIQQEHDELFDGLREVAILACQEIQVMLDKLKPNHKNRMTLYLKGESTETIAYQEGKGVTGSAVWDMLDRIFKRWGIYDSKNRESMRQFYQWGEIMEEKS